MYLQNENLIKKIQAWMGFKPMTAVSLIAQYIFIGTALHQDHRVQIPFNPEFFSGLIFATA